jgi:hypothetical protein
MEGPVIAEKPVDLNALGSDDFAIETAEMRYARRHGNTQVARGHDDPVPGGYGMQDAVWRPDGRGANDTIFKPFYWNGRKVRALKPTPVEPRGEQWKFPGKASSDYQIGLMTGDVRFQGDEAVSSRAFGDRTRFNRFQDITRHARNPGLGGALVEGLYGVDEDTVAAEARRDQVKEAIALGGSAAAQARPIEFMQKSIEAQVFSALEDANHESRAMQFLLDPDANNEYNKLAMGAVLPGVNATGDYNIGSDANYGLDRGLMYLPPTTGMSSARAGGRAGNPASGTIMTDTLNAVKVRTADMHSVNTSNGDDSRTIVVEAEDEHATQVRTHVKDQGSTTKVLFNKSSRGPETDSHGQFAAEQAPLSASRRYKRKEQDQGPAHVTYAGRDVDGPDRAPLSAARRYKRKEQQQGPAHVTYATRDIDGPDAAPLSAARRMRRKELERGPVSAGTASRDQDVRDSAPLTASRNLRRKELDQGANHNSMQSAVDLDGPDAAPLTSARMLRRKEIDRVDSWSGTAGMDVGDTQHRLSAPRKRLTQTGRTMTAALLPYAGYDNAGEFIGQDNPVLAQVPSQEQRGAERAAGRRQFGLGVLRATESDQFVAQKKIDPNVVETLSRSTQQVNLRDRRAQQTQISVRNYDEVEALHAAYAADNAWVERGRGKLAHPVFYESGDDSGAESS